MAKIRTSPTGSGAAAGFSLLELLVVLVIMAIVAGYAGSRMFGSLDRPAMEAASGELAAVLRRARSSAIAQNAPVTVRVDVDATSFGIPGDRVYKVSDRLKLSLFTAVTEQQTTSVGEIRFFPDGSSTGGEVTLTGGNARGYVQVDWLTGRVATYEETATR